jgi:hypothetical protein
VRRNLFSAASAAALSLALVAGAPAIGQGLDDAAARGLAQLGIQAPPTESLSTEQVAEIQNVLSSTDTDDIKRARIQEILGGSEATATGRLGVRQLQSSVGADLASIGIDTSGLDMLTLGQLAQIENVMNTDEPDDIKRMRVEEIIGGEASATGRLGVGQLQSSVAAGLASLGIDAEGIEALSLEQLAQIENVINSTDADDIKRGRIDQIMAQ